MASSLSFVSSRPLATLVAGCIASVLLVACEDPAIEKQRQFEKQFNEVTASFADTLGGRPDLLSSMPTDESIAALREVADRAKSLSGGTAGQMNAARALAASVYRTAAAIEIARAKSIESSLAVERGLAIGYNEIAADLEAIASAAENLDLSGARGVATDDRDTAAREARKSQEALRGLEGPASELNARIARGTARLNELGQEVAVLLRKARELSPSAGLEFVEQAAGIKAEARELSLKTSNEQIDAARLTGDANIEGATLKKHQALQAAASGALELLGNFDADLDSQAAKARETAAEMRRSAEALLKSIADTRGGALKAAYAAAEADLGNCASDADSDSLRWTIAVEELRMHSAQVDGLVSQGRMLAAMGGAGLGDVKSTAQTALGALKDKATAASEMFANMGEDPSVAGLKAYADGVKKFAESSVDTLMAPPKLVEPKATASAGKAGGSKSGAASGRSMSGAAVEDIEAFVARMNDADPATAAEMMLSVMDDSTPGGKAMKSITSAMLPVMGDLIRALHEKWGAEGVAALQGGGMAGGMGGGMMGGGSQKLTKKSIDGDRAVFATDEGAEVVFTKTASGWKTDITESMDPEQLEQMQQVAPMMSMMMAPIGKAAKAVAARIRAGEFSSPDEVQAALREEAMKGMGGGFGGGGGAGR
jgi:hypothetical protein